MAFQTSALFDFANIPYFDEAVITTWNKSVLKLVKFNHSNRWLMPSYNICFVVGEIKIVNKLSNFDLI